MNHFSKSKPKADQEAQQATTASTKPGPTELAPANEFIVESAVIRTELPLDLDTRDDLHSATGQFKGGFWRKQLLKRLDRLDQASVNLIELHENQISARQIGSSDDAALRASVVVSDQDFFKRILFGGTIGSAESYIDGQWACDDLTTLIRIMIRNLDRFKKLEKGVAWIKNAHHRLRHRSRRNSIDGSRKNIRDHYDLGNDFYQLFLDPTLSYSSGIFSSLLPFRPSENAMSVMESASLEKMNSVCRKLQLSPKDHVLEIGTGWGGLAIHMAKHFGCRVTTTTISREQYAKAIERVGSEGLSGQVEVLYQDYRELTGKFNKLVSIEMIEAVGHQYYDEFFSRCSELLTQDGAMLLQAITIGEQDFDYHKNHVDFIRKYVFPGGCLPSVAALSQSVGRVTNMRMLHQQDITPHYVKTLQHWRFEFMNKLDKVKSLGYDDAFIRLWHFYLCYCEAAFAERRVHNVHLIYGKPESDLDLVY